MNTSPKRVAPWVTSSVVSWSDVEKFSAAAYMTMGRFLGRLQEADFGGDAVEVTAPVANKSLKSIRKQCLRINLNVSARKVTRILRSKSFTPSEFKVSICDLGERIADELRGVFFLRMTTSQAEMFTSNTPLFGERVFQAFPSANYDIAEAGKCLACERSTAAVFHLMRVMEAGLKVLARGMDITYAPSWESYLTQITRACFINIV